MMSQELLILTITAASIGLFHTLLGPDHYLPFIVMARAGKWSPIKTTWITVLCGIGHILGSVLLGFIGIALGIAVTKIRSSGIISWWICSVGTYSFWSGLFCLGVTQGIEE